MAPATVMQQYHELWQIEEAFKITKSDLETRPVYVSEEDHVEAHFLSCFVALLLARLMKKDVGTEFPLRSMLEDLRQATCTHVGDNVYAFQTLTDSLVAIGQHYGIPFDNRYMQYGDILKVQAKLKKG